MLALRTSPQLGVALFLGATLIAQSGLAERDALQLGETEEETLDTRRRSERRSAKVARRRAARRSRRARVRRSTSAQLDAAVVQPETSGSASTPVIASEPQAVSEPRGAGSVLPRVRLDELSVHDSRANERGCENDLGCAHDELCSAGRCSARRGAAPAAHEAQEHAHPRLFVEVGVGVGITSLSRGRAPDRLPESSALERAALRATDEASGEVDTERVERELREEGWDCRAAADDERIRASDCAVAVQQPGLAADPIFDAAVGYHVLPRFAVALTALVQRNYGVGPMAGILVGARAEYLMVAAHERGLQLGALAGFGVGALQAHARGAHHERPRATNAHPGQIGASVSLGFKLAYRTHRHLALGVTPLFNVGLPNILFDVGLTGGVEVAF